MDEESSCPNTCAVQEVVIALGAPDPCYPLYNILQEIIDQAIPEPIPPAANTITSADNSIEVVTTPGNTDLSITLTSTDGSVTITAPTGANPGDWNLSVADTTTFTSTPTIDVAGTGAPATPYQASLSAGALSAGSGITVAQQPDDSFVISSTVETTPFGTHQIRYVSQEWSTPPTTGYHFTTVGAAQASILAETPVPNFADPYTIFIYPGIYTEVVNGISNINLVGLGADETRIGFTWTAGAGSNAGSVNLQERIFVSDIQLSIGTATSTYVDSTAKTGGDCWLVLDNCNQIGNGVLVGSTASSNLYRASDTRITSPGGITQDNFVAELNNSYTDIAAYILDTALVTIPRQLLVTGGSFLVAGAATINDSTIEVMNARINGSWTANNGNIRVVNSTPYVSWNLNLLAESIGFIINTPYDPGSITSGDATGESDQSTQTFLSPALVVGNNAIPIPLPYVNATYRAAFTGLVTTTLDRSLVVVSRTTTTITVESSVAQAAGAYEIVLTQPEFMV